MWKSKLIFQSITFRTILLATQIIATIDKKHYFTRIFNWPIINSLLDNNLSIKCIVATHYDNRRKNGEFRWRLQIDFQPDVAFQKYVLRRRRKKMFLSTCASMEGLIFLLKM